MGWFESRPGLHVHGRPELQPQMKFLMAYRGGNGWLQGTDLWEQEAKKPFMLPLSSSPGVQGNPRHRTLQKNLCSKPWLALPFLIGP